MRKGQTCGSTFPAVSAHRRQVKIHVPTKLVHECSQPHYSYKWEQPSVHYKCANARGISLSHKSSGKTGEP